MLQKKKRVLFIAGGAALLIALLCILLLFSFGQFGKHYLVNKADTETGASVADNFQLYSGDHIGFSFLYPAERTVGWSENDGAYIYCGSGKEAPYVLVCRTDKSGMNPEKYFKACDRMLLDKFPNLQSTPIQEAKVGDKTLYLVRYISGDLVIDRYLELYDRFYLQYTAISNEKGSLNTELYYAITTLRVQENAYTGAYSENVSLHQAEDIGLAVNIPDMLETKELTIGYFSSSNDAIMLTVRIAKDDDGKAIYNRQDFIDRAAEAPGFVAGLLGADSAAFTEGQKTTYGGKSFYCYPMDMKVGEESFSGELCLANADESGCWLVCYAVRDGSIMQEQLLSLMKECASGIVID